MAQHPPDRPEVGLPERGYPPSYPERDVVERDDADDEDELDSWPAYRTFDRGTRKERHKSERDRGTSRNRDEYRTASLRALLLDKYR